MKEAIETAKVAIEAGEMQVYLVASELVVGENRFAVGLQTSDNAIIDDADVADDDP